MGRRQVLFGLILSLFFIYIVLWQPHLGGLLLGRRGLWDALFGTPRLDFKHIVQILGEVRMLPLLICFLLTPLHVLIRSHRWTLMVSSLGRLRVWDAFSLQMVGYFTNSVLPLRMGEVVRGVLLGSRMGITRSSGLGTVLLERVLDMISMLIVMSAVSFLYPFPRQVAEGAAAFGALATIGLVVILYLSFRRDPFGGSLGRLIGGRRVGRVIREKGEHFAAGFALLRQTQHHFIVVLETGLLWLLYAAQGYLTLSAFDFPRQYPLIAAQPILASFVILVINSIGVSLPSGPAGVGTFHAIAIFGLSLFDVATDQAAGFALVIHAVTVIFYIFGGLPLMWREGLHIGELKRLGPNRSRSAGQRRTPDEGR